MLALDGTLDLSVDGIPAQLIAAEGEMRIEVEHPRAFLRASGMFRAEGTGYLRLLAQQLNENGLTLRIVSRGRTMVVVGRDAESGLTGRVMGIPHLDVHLGASILRLLAR